MENRSRAEVRRIAYRNIECPCCNCPGRDDLYCKVYDTEIRKDSEDVYIPCPACEADAMKDRREGPKCR